MSGPPNQQGCHPIAQEAVACFPSGFSKRTRPDPTKLRELEAKFKLLLSSKDALDAALTLLRVSHLIAKDAPEGGRAIFEVARLAIPALERLTGGDALSAAARALKFMGQQKTTTMAPKGAARGGLSLLACRTTKGG